MTKRIGAFVGKFYPPHIGHVWAVEQAAKHLDEVYVVISANKIRNQQLKQKDNFATLNPRLIKKWFKKHFRNNKKIKVKIFDESGLKPYPDDRDVWAAKFKKQFPKVNVKIADESYRQYNEQYFAEYEFFPIERDAVAIHSTNIRQNLQQNFDFLIDEAKPYFKKILKNKK